MTESGSSSVAFRIRVMQCRTNQCGLPCKYSGTSFLIVSTTLEDTFVLHVIYLKYRSRPHNTVADLILPVTYKYPPQTYFAICAGTKTLMSRYINLDINILWQQLRKEYLNLLFCASVLLFVLSYSWRPTPESLNPHLQNKKKQQLLLPTGIIAIHYETTLHLVTLLLWCPLAACSSCGSSGT